MARPVIDITGQKFGKLTALHYDKNGRWIRLCDCGNKKSIERNSVIRYTEHRTIKSCGCLGKENNNSFGVRNKIHGMTNTHFFRKRDGIQGRCNRPTHSKYYLRGGKLIKCEWQSFQEFMNDMYGSYLEHVELFGEKQTTIDRIDGNRNYSKSNCRWATYKEQNNNISTNGVRVPQNNYGPIPVFTSNEK